MLFFLTNDSSDLQQNSATFNYSLRPNCMCLWGQAQHPLWPLQLYTKGMQLTIQLGSYSFRDCAEHSPARILAPAMSLCGIKIFSVPLFSKTVKNGQNIQVKQKTHIEPNQGSNSETKKITNLPWKSSTVPTHGTAYISSWWDISLHFAGLF